MNVRDRVKKLMATALDEAGNDKERLSAAFAALKLIRDNDLLASPLDGLMSSSNEHLQAAGSIFETLSDPEFVRKVKKVASAVSSARRKRR
jgi:hypothetical protein